MVACKPPSLSQLIAISKSVKGTSPKVDEQTLMNLVVPTPLAIISAAVEYSVECMVATVVSCTSSSSTGGILKSSIFVFVTEQYKVFSDIIISYFKSSNILFISFKFLTPPRLYV